MERATPVGPYLYVLIVLISFLAIAVLLPVVLQTYRQVHRLFEELETLDADKFDSELEDGGDMPDVQDQVATEAAAAAAAPPAPSTPSVEEAATSKCCRIG